MTVPSIAPASAASLAAAGEVTLLDLRAPASFAAGHPRGALSLPFSARGLGERARVVLPPSGAVVLVVPDDATADVAAEQLAAAGIPVRAALADGFDGWRDAGLSVAAIGEVGVDELAESVSGATVIDVREPMEWTTGHVPGALLVPLGELRGSLASIPKDRPVITICEAGVRSSTAASLLADAGFADVAHVPAGSSGYRASGLPLAYPALEVTR